MDSKKQKINDEIAKIQSKINSLWDTYIDRKDGSMRQDEAFERHFREELDRLKKEKESLEKQR
jgi:hypothetical protein